MSVIIMFIGMLISSCYPPLTNDTVETSANDIPGMEDSYQREGNEFELYHPLSLMEETEQNFEHEQCP